MVASNENGTGDVATGNVADFAPAGTTRSQARTGTASDCSTAVRLFPQAAPDPTG